MAEDIEPILDRLMTIPSFNERETSRLLMEGVFIHKPDLSVEIGVWHGRGVCALGMAHKILGIGRVIGIDPFAADELADGQAYGDESVYQDCLRYIKEFELENFVEIIRKKSDDVIPPDGIGILRVDGKHGIQTVFDVHRFGDKVLPGGALLLDDDRWAGAEGATDWLVSHSWRRVRDMHTGSIWNKPWTA